jgi:hypothetical protein
MLSFNSENFIFPRQAKTVLLHVVLYTVSHKYGPYEIHLFGKIRKCKVRSVIANHVSNLVFKYVTSFDPLGIYILNHSPSIQWLYSPNRTLAPSFQVS